MSRYDQHDRERWVREDPAQKRADRDDFARDRARVLHSASLRRLAAKTQVVQPGSDDFVRNRLTHSLEVAQIGREFGAVLGCDADLVDTACLAHDLGHPPFGHNGEAILNEVCQPIGGFESNAQTLRLLTRLEAKRSHPDGRPAGLNLTRASLDAALKYPWSKTAARSAGDGATRPESRTKFGVYEDDLPVFRWIRNGMSLGDRHPCIEAQVMDWSDDVAYSVHDVEDAVTGGLLDLRVLRSAPDMAVVYQVARRWYAPDVTESELAEATGRLLASDVVPTSFDASRQALAALKDMTSRLIGSFVRLSEVATQERYGPAPLIRHAGDLVVPEAARAECAVLKSLAAHFVMTTPEHLEVMGHQREVVEALVAAYQAEPEPRLDIPYREDYLAAGAEPERLRAVVDQVASLSDARASLLFHRWC